MEAGIVRAKRLLRTEREDDTSRGSQVVLVVLFPRCQALETGQQVIDSDRPEANVLVDLDVNTATRRPAVMAKADWESVNRAAICCPGPGNRLFVVTPSNPVSVASVTAFTLLLFAIHATPNKT